MSESGGEFSEQDVIKDKHVSKEPATYNRRQILAGGVAASLSLKGVKEALFGRSSTTAARTKETQPEPNLDKQSEFQIQTAIEAVSENTVQSQKVSQPESKVTEHVASIDPYYDQLSPEQQRLVDETATHLTEVYGPHMEAKFYQTEESKQVFFKKLTEIGLKLNPQNPNLGNQLAAVLAWESGFSPVRVSNNGSKGIGLIQFTGDVPANLNTTRDTLETLSPLEQLDYVYRYLKSQQEYFGGDFSSLGKTYPLVINPSKIDVSYDAELFPKDSPEAQRNLVLDKNKDGIITVGEAIEVVRDNAINNYGENPKFLADYRLNEMPL